MNGNLVICFHQVDFGKHGETGELVRVIMDVRDRVTVGDGSGVEGSVIAAGAPAVVLAHEARGG
jgi:hypothetical protein